MFFNLLKILICEVVTFVFSPEVFRSKLSFSVVLRTYKSHVFDQAFFL